MKKFRSFFSICLFLSVLSASAVSGPEICWLETVHDFGAFDEELGLVTCTFKAVNTGTEPLIVISARANCGCTTPRYNQEPVAPGDTLSVSVSYDAKGRPGRFDKKVYVTSNADKRSVLTITGTVIGTSNSLKGRYPVEAGKMRLSTSVLPFGEVLKGHTTNTMFRGYNSSEDTIRPLVISSPDYLRFTVSPGAVPPGEQFAVSGIASTGDFPTVWGLVTDSIKIVADKSDYSSGSQTLSTVIIVNEDFSNLNDEDRKKAPVAKTETEMIDMKIINRTDNDITLKSKITNTGKNPLLIHRVYSPDKSLSVSVGSDKVKGGKSTDFIITVKPSEIPVGEPLNARITLITNDPVYPTRIIRVVGEVK